MDQDNHTEPMMRPSRARASFQPNNDGQSALRTAFVAVGVCLVAFGVGFGSGWGAHHATSSSSSSSSSSDSTAFVADVSEEVPQYWRDGTGLAITFSMNIEEGGQSAPMAAPVSAAMEGLRAQYQWGAREGPNSPPGADNGCTGERCYTPDWATNNWYEYGAHEGTQRLLAMYNDFGIKVSSYMVALAAYNQPENIRRIVASGHEVVCHGLTWSLLNFMSFEDEVAFHRSAREVLFDVSGQNCTGFNAYWLQDSNNTLSILQSLGLNYHVDDLSRDIPFTRMVNGKPFAIVPYSLINNDIEGPAVQGYSPQDFYDQLVMEFDQLYSESKTRRRMMSISSHARYAGRPSYAQAYRRFIQYAGAKSGVWFVRKDWMANWALENGPRYNCSANPPMRSLTLAGTQVNSVTMCPESSCLCGCGPDAEAGSVSCQDYDKNAPKRS